MERITLKTVTLKTMVIHTVSYFVMGVLAMFIMDYASLFETPVMKEYMRPISHPLVQAGVLFQPLRGLLFGLVFYVFRDAIFSTPGGWKNAWLMLVVVGILSTFGPSPGSIEGMIYTQLPLWSHLRGLPEIILQALLLAYVTHSWLTHPEKRWIPRTLIGIFILLFAMLVVGLVLNSGQS